MIKIEWQQKPPKRGEKAGDNELFPRMIDNGIVDFDTLCTETSKGSVFTKGTLSGSFSDLMEKVAKYLAEGKAVDLKDLGTLRLSIGTDDPVTASTKRRGDKVKVKGVNFVPSEQLMKAIGQPQFEWAAEATSQFAPSVEQLKAPLLAYLEEHGKITRKQFEETFRLKRTTAIDRLNAFVRMGLIVPKGSTRERVYVKNQKES